MRLSTPPPTRTFRYSEGGLVARVSLVSASTAFLGTLILFIGFFGLPATKLLFFPPVPVIIVSMGIWIPAALFFRSRRVRLWRALLFGAASPFIGLVWFWMAAYWIAGVPEWRAVFLFVAIPIGVLTALLVHRLSLDA